MLVASGTIKGWSVLAAIVILCREILVSGLREFLAGVQVTVPVTWVAKWKTTAQFVSLGFLIGAPALDHVAGINTGQSTFIGLILLWVAALLTVHTGLEYGLAGLRSSSSLHYKR
jgi:phosphatidylglycerophosphate synthase